MRHALIVGAGGAIGAASRFLFSNTLQRLLGHDFPWGTLGVNILGCTIAGVFVGAMLRWEWSYELRLLLITGVLGGFTTFSALSMDAYVLYRDHQMLQLLGYLIGSFVGVGGGFLLGHALARAWTA